MCEWNEHMCYDYSCILCHPHVNTCVMIIHVFCVTRM